MNETEPHDKATYNNLQKKYSSKLNKAIDAKIPNVKLKFKEQYILTAWKMFDILIQPLDELQNLIKDCHNYLEDIQFQKLYKESENVDELIPVPIICTYDKNFYCTAYIAQFCDVLNCSLSSEGELQYIVAVDKSNVELLSILLYLTVSCRGLSYRMDNLQNNIENILYGNHPAYKLRNRISALTEQFGNNEIITKSDLIIAANDISRKHFAIRSVLRDDIFKDIIYNNFVLNKWSSEYKLYNLINMIFDDVEYQYSSDWLDVQTLDIYISEMSIAIEYQGKQHYEAVDYFGADEALIYNIQRDIEKKQKCNINQVKLLEWKYTTPINYHTILEFFANNGLDNIIDMIDIVNKVNSNNISSTLELLELARPHNTYTKTKENLPTSVSSIVIRRYTIDGVFLDEFKSARIASEQTSISERSIRKCIYGERKTGGGSLWKRAERSSEKIDIEAIAIEQRNNTAKVILQFDLNDSLISEFYSLRQAVNETGVNQRSIPDALKCIQKTAGGFLWKYK